MFVNHESQVLVAQINNYYTLASNLAIKAIETEARFLMRKHPDLNEFVMAMGSYFFTSKKNIPGSPNNIIDPEPEYLTPFNDMINELDEKFNVTGYPMRFTVDGEIINNW